MADFLTDDQRRLARLGGDTIGPLALRVKTIGVSVSANVRDISIHGIGLLAKEPFATGTAFLIETGPPGKTLATELSVELRHATKLPDGDWLLGCTFSRPLTTEDFAILG
jgi:hypothetical protein